jgi:hypothetical protein
MDLLFVSTMTQTRLILWQRGKTLCMCRVGPASLRLPENKRVPKLNH